VVVVGKVQKAASDSRLERGRGQGGSWKGSKMPPPTRVWSEGGRKVVVVVGKVQKKPLQLAFGAKERAGWW
jgi:hypothetical protein